IENGYSQLEKGQTGFPDAEIQAMTFYLFKSSEMHLARLTELHEPKGAGDHAKQQKLLQDVNRLEDSLKDSGKSLATTPDDALPLALPAATLVRKLQDKPDLLSKLTKEQVATAIGYLTEQERYHGRSAPLHLLPDPAELKSGDAKAGEV